MHNMYHRLTYL